MTDEEIIAGKKNFPNILEKARSKANRRYPSILEIDDDAEFGEYDINEAKRDIFIEGYLEAEKDLGWISVKERLPETDGYYFTCSDVSGVPQCIGATFFSTKRKAWEDEYGELHVDFWMPCPELPEK